MSTSEPALSYWAIVTRGLEPIAQGEIHERVPDAEPTPSYRRVAFETRAAPEVLLSLRTVDDLFVDLGAWEGIGHTRAALTLMGARAAELDLRDPAAICGTVRELHTPPTFSVTANFVGRRNYSTDEIKLAVATNIGAMHGWEYEARDADADLNVRIFIEHETAFLGIRLGQTPLHERTYKVATIAGSLKPTVAAAMVRLGRLPPGAIVVDPLCGAGTIPIEAALAGLRAAGGDQDISALEAARRNTAQAGVEVAFEEWDARELPLAAGSVDGIVCNLPWGRQVEIAEETVAFYQACLAEMKRVLRHEGRLVLLTSHQSLLQAAAERTGLEIETEIEISLSGQTPFISTLHPTG